MKNTQLEAYIKSYQQTKDETAFEEILKYFEPTLKNTSKNIYENIEYKMPYYSEDDLFVEAQLLLIEAIKIYNLNDENRLLFQNFANNHIFHHLSSQCVTLSRHGKKIPFAESCDYNTDLIEDNISSDEIIGEIADKEIAKKIQEALDKLTKKEKKFYILYNNIGNHFIGDGFTFNELGIMFGIARSDANYFLSVIEKKLYDILEEPISLSKSALSTRHSKKDRDFMDNEKLKLKYAESLFNLTFETPEEKQKALELMDKKSETEQDIISSYYGLQNQKLDLKDLATKHNLSEKNVYNILKDFTCEVLKIPPRSKCK